MFGGPGGPRSLMAQEASKPKSAGATLARLAAGDDLPRAARAANVAAALSTQGVGAVAPLPRWAQVAPLINESTA